MITYKFIYNRKNKFKRDGTALVHLEIYKNRERKYISTGVFVKPECWDSKNTGSVALTKTESKIYRLRNELGS